MTKRMVLLVLIVLNLGIIFFFSHQDGVTSTKVSNAISRQIEVNTPDYQEKNQGEKNVLHANTQRSLRQNAHVLLFATLGALVLLFLTTFSLRWYWNVVMTAVFGFLCAVGDEYHQSFVPGRTAQRSDVQRDMQGILIGICIVLLILAIKNLFKYRKKRAGI